MVPSSLSSLPSKPQRPPSHPSSSRTRTLSRSRSQLRPASTSSPLLCPVNQAQARDYFNPSFYHTRSHSSIDLRTTRERQRLSIDSLGILKPIIGGLQQRRSYVTVPRPKSIGDYSTKGIKPCPTTIASAEKMTGLFNQLASALKADTRVVFENDGSVDMLGGLNTGSSYSLPGHITITMPSLPSGYEGKLRELRELKLVFESKSEYWDDQGRYTPSRVFTSTLDLATVEKPLLIPSSDPLKSHARTIELAVNFDLKLPGWLPSSRLSSLANTEHGVVVRSSIGWTEAASLAYDPPHIGHRLIQTRSIKRSTNLLAQLAGVTESTSSPYTPITIRRHRLPSAMHARHVDGAERHYSLKPVADSTSPIECIVSVPDWVDVNGGEKDLKLSIRIRARREAVQSLAGQPEAPARADSLVVDTSPDESAGAVGVAQTLDTTGPSSVAMERDLSGEILTHILELGMEVDEIETYTSHPSTSFSALFPIPEQQPSRFSSDHALIAPRPPQAQPSSDVAGNIDEKPFGITRRRKCLLADDGSQRNFIFDNDGLAMSERWRKVNIVLPMPRGKKGSPNCRPRSEYESPMLRVKHSLNVRVVCKNVGNEGEDIIVVLTTPIRFGSTPKTMPRAGPTRPSLPAYIQLFHENGELRECDPLPLYPTPTPTCRPPAYTPYNRTQPLLPAHLINSKSPGIESRYHYPQLSTSSRSSSIDESMDLDSATSSDDGHSEVSSSSSSGVRPIPIPTMAGASPRVGLVGGTHPPSKFQTQAVIAASA